MEKSGVLTGSGETTAAENGLKMRKKRVDGPGLLKQLMAAVDLIIVVKDRTAEVRAPCMNSC